MLFTLTEKQIKAMEDRKVRLLEGYTAEIAETKEDIEACKELLKMVHLSKKDKDSTRESKKQHEAYLKKLNDKVRDVKADKVAIQADGGIIVMKWSLLKELNKLLKGCEVYVQIKGYKLILNYTTRKGSKGAYELNADFDEYSKVKHQLIEFGSKWDSIVA